MTSAAPSTATQTRLPIQCLRQQNTVCVFLPLQEGLLFPYRTLDKATAVSGTHCIQLFPQNSGPSPPFLIPPNSRKASRDHFTWRPLIDQNTCLPSVNLRGNQNTSRSHSCRCHLLKKKGQVFAPRIYSGAKFKQILHTLVLFHCNKHQGRTKGFKKKEKQFLKTDGVLC